MRRISRRELQLWEEAKSQYPSLARVVENAPGSRTPDEVDAYLGGMTLSGFRHPYDIQGAPFVVKLDDLGSFAESMMSEAKFAEDLYDEWIAWQYARDHIS